MNPEVSGRGPGEWGERVYARLHARPTPSVAPWQSCYAPNSGVGGAPPNMLIGPKLSPPELVKVTEAADVSPTLISPKSMLVVLIDIWVSTA